MKKIISVFVVLIVLIIIYSVSSGIKLHNSELKILTEQENKQMNESDIINFDGTYELDTNVSKVTWVGRKKLIKDWVDKGLIDAKSGTISINNSQSDWATTSGEIVFDMTTIRSIGSKGTSDPSSRLDTHLKSEDFFDIANFPESSFVLKNVIPEDGKYKLEGDLTIKGVTKPVTLASIEEIDFVEGGENKAIEAKGKVTFNRADFGVRYGSDSFFDNLGDNIIDNEVTLELVLVALKK